MTARDFAEFAANARHASRARAIDVGRPAPHASHQIGWKQRASRDTHRAAMHVIRDADGKLVRGRYVKMGFDYRF